MVTIHPTDKHTVVGITAGTHSCSVACARNGKLVTVIEEERLLRQKYWVDFENNFFRWPLYGLTALRDRFGVNFDDVDYFTAFWDYDTINNILKQTVGYYGLTKERFIKSDHHETHCYLAYYLSGFTKPTFAISMDGAGEGYSSKFFIGTDGMLQYLDGISLNHASFGMFYSALTELLGFKRLKDEGKIVGMSSHGKMWEEMYNAFNKLIIVDGIQTNKLPAHNDPQSYIWKQMYQNFYNVVGTSSWKNSDSMKNIAYCGQRVFEEKILQILNNLHQKYPNIRNLALSGGVFANVKLNQKINELDWVDEVFITPAMSDEGLPLGSILYSYTKLNKQDVFKPIRLPHTFYGREFSQQEVYEAAKKIGNFSVDTSDIDIVTITKELIDGKIIGLFQGKSEHGPRALGNRIIICNATNPDVYRILNDRLQRNDFMPFAPAVLDEDADTIFEINKSRYTAEFMNMCYNTRKEWVDKIPTVIHPVDKTARIQIVTKTSNETFYNILQEYKKHSGFGCLVNTSFNVHNEPIVDSPEEAFIHLKNGIVDILVTDYGIFKA